MNRPNRPNIGTFFQLDFGHLGMEPLWIRQRQAGAGQKIAEVWWGGRYHEIPSPPIPLQKSPHLAAIFLVSGFEKKGQSRV
jgi:hypothetical protein